MQYSSAFLKSSGEVSRLISRLRGLSGSGRNWSALSWYAHIIANFILSRFGAFKNPSSRDSSMVRFPPYQYQSYTNTVIPEFEAKSISFATSAGFLPSRYPVSGR